MNTNKRKKRHALLGALGFGAVALGGSFIGTPPAQAAGDLELQVTVSTTAGECGEPGLLTVQAGDTVYYCYTMTNGIDDATVLISDLTDSNLGTILDQEEHLLDPFDSFSVISDGVVIEGPTINSATWTAFGLEGVNLGSANGSARVEVQDVPTDTVPTPTVPPVDTTPERPEDNPTPEATPAPLIQGTPVFTG